MRLVSFELMSEYSHSITASVSSVETRSGRGAGLVFVCFFFSKRSRHVRSNCSLHTAFARVMFKTSPDRRRPCAKQGNAQTSEWPCNFLQDVFGITLRERKEEFQSIYPRSLVIRCVVYRHSYNDCFSLRYRRDCVTEA